MLPMVMLSVVAILASLKYAAISRPVIEAVYDAAHSGYLVKQRGCYIVIL